MSEKYGECCEGFVNQEGVIMGLLITFHVQEDGNKIGGRLLLVWRSCCAYPLVSATDMFRNAGMKKKRD
jgi:hypothetical protein